MGLFDFFKKKKEEPKTVVKQRPSQPAPAITSTSKPIQAASVSNNLFSKTELENLIKILSKISYIFQSSGRLVGGRNQTMMSRTHSYAGILGYYYESEYKYGKMADIVDAKIAQHFVLVNLSMVDATHRKKVVSELAENWSDVLQVIYNLQLDSNDAGNELKMMESDIKKVTAAFEKLSGAKCRTPKNPLNVVPRKVSFNPYHITEDLNRAVGHTIPDVTSVFAQELIPEMVSALGRGQNPKDVVANYVISMIKSYYDNAGFVPMVIVDQLTGQINQVAEMVQRVSYSPYPSLKEYVLSKIYK